MSNTHGMHKRHSINQLLKETINFIYVRKRRIPNPRIQIPPRHILQNLTPMSPFVFDEINRRDDIFVPQAIVNTELRNNLLCVFFNVSMIASFLKRFDCIEFFLCEAVNGRFHVREPDFGLGSLSEFLLWMAVLL